MNNYEGFEVDQERSTDDEIVLVKKKAKQVESWEDLGFVDGYIVDTQSVIVDVQLSTNKSNRNLWATKEQAQGSLVKSQLSHLILRANEGWKPDWSDDGYKYCINFYRYEIVTIKNIHNHSFLAFKSKETRDKFLELHRDLIEQAKPLL